MSFEAYTYAEMVRQVQHLVQDSSPNTEVVIREQLNLEYLERAKQSDWKELQRRRTENIQVIAGQAFLALPGDCQRISSIHDTSQDITFFPSSVDQVTQDNLPSISSTGTVVFYSEIGRFPIKRPLSQDDTVVVTNTNAADDGKQVFLSGTNSIGNYHDESVAVATAGTTSVNTYEEGWSIVTFATNEPPTASAGNAYVLTQTTGGAVLGEIVPGQVQNKYMVIQFDQVPASTSNLIVIYKRKPRILVNDFDTPIVDISDAIIEGTVARLRMFDQSYQQASFHKQIADQKVFTELKERDHQKNTKRQVRPDFRLRGLRRGFRGIGTRRIR